MVAKHRADGIKHQRSADHASGGGRGAAEKRSAAAESRAAGVARHRRRGVRQLALRPITRLRRARAYARHRAAPRSARTEHGIAHGIEEASTLRVGCCRAVKLRLQLLNTGIGALERLVLD